MPPPTHSDPHISQHHPLDHQTKTKTTHTTHQRTKTKTNISHRRSHTHSTHHRTIFDLRRSKHTPPRSLPIQTHAHITTHTQLQSRPNQTRNHTQQIPNQNNHLPKPQLTDLFSVSLNGDISQSTLI